MAIVRKPSHVIDLTPTPGRFPILRRCAGCLRAVDPVIQLWWVRLVNHVMVYHGLPWFTMFYRVQDYGLVWFPSLWFTIVSYGLLWFTEWKVFFTVVYQVMKLIWVLLWFQECNGYAISIGDCAMLMECAVNPRPGGWSEPGDNLTVVAGHPAQPVPFVSP